MNSWRNSLANPFVCSRQERQGTTEIYMRSRSLFFMQDPCSSLLLIVADPLHTLRKLPSENMHYAQSMTCHKISALDSMGTNKNPHTCLTTKGGKDSRIYSSYVHKSATQIESLQDIAIRSSMGGGRTLSCQHWDVVHQISGSALPGDGLLQRHVDCLDLQSQNKKFSGGEAKGVCALNRQWFCYHKRPSF